MKTTPNTFPEKQYPAGFALITIMSVMALLVMIALAMLSLSTIAVRASKNGKAMAEAKANARMALMIAIGELQKSAGPDQRITANADVSGASRNK
jgi:type II secretory pathway component PulK